jgi:3'-phosphoadenosine 5'-phosphosulfate sulfotransferase
VFIREFFSYNPITMKTKLSSLLFMTLLSSTSWSMKLTDYRPFKFEVLFTNPECDTYKYGSSVISESGKILEAKPDDVYCRPSDEAQSVKRKTSPQYRLVEWISASDTKEIHAAYLSFSSKNIVKAMCSALKKGVKIKMVLDGEVNKEAEGLKKCGDFSITYRGSTGGLGFAHNKILLVNPNSSTETKIVFSSGNMTSGTSINHENWNFITTSSRSFFALAHKCAIESMIVAGDTKKNFTESLNACRAKILAKPETDITAYFSPVDGKAALEKVTAAAKSADLVEAMSHRFSGAIADLFADLVRQKKPIKFILDDDIYWSAKLRKNVGRNTSIEAFKIYNELFNKGMETRFLQTNQNVYQLQHNKFMIFSRGRTGGVFNGAGNMTTAAFTKNFENFYYISIPEVYLAYKKQYELYYDKMATSPEDMPRDYLLP